MTVTKVGVLGARGKVGTAICEAVRDAEDLELVAGEDLGLDHEWTLALQ